MAEKLNYGKQYDQYNALIREANLLPKEQAKSALSKIQLDLFMKYGIDDENVKQLIKKFKYYV